MCREKLPVWRQKFEQYRSEDFTVVGLALDAEGIAPAKLYYEKFGIEFPSLVDPNYATQFGVIPKTFFVNEHGVVQDLRGWESRLSKLGKPRPVTKEIASQWSRPASRLDSDVLSALVQALVKRPDDLEVATQLGSRYLALGLFDESRAVLQRVVKGYDAKAIARDGGSKSRLLGQAYLQLLRSCPDDREAQIQYATISYYVNPTIGFAKQITRIIDPTKFDHRGERGLDNDFREGAYQQLRRQRAAWLSK